MILPQLGIILRETSFKEIVFLGYEFGKNHTSVNHLLFLEYLKLFAKNKKQLSTLINTVRIFSEDKRTDFDISKYGAVIMRKGNFPTLTKFIYRQEKPFMRSIKRKDHISRSLIWNV